MGKRAFDIVVAVLSLLLLSPALVLIASAVLLSSGRPVLYRQERIGLGGRPFRIIKFRSMVKDAERLAPNVSATHDPRVTRIGRSLRKYYLDELPQLFNVLKGEMSLVGPRPETPEYVARYLPEEWQVLTVRPGIAGPSTLAFMDEADALDRAQDPESFYVTTVLHQRVQLDLQYLTRRSLTYDVGLLMRQFIAILKKVSR